MVASSPLTPIAAFEHSERRLYGVQFHPEVVHTPYGNELLKNFLYTIADAPPTWTAAAVIEEQVERIRGQVGAERVLCALSGGVDSSVAARCSSTRRSEISSRASSSTTGCSARTRPPRLSRRFATTSMSSAAPRRRGALARLDGVTDPEEKRRAIGEEFIRVFEEESKALGTIGYLVQGTLYSDVIESGGSDGVAATIKSHHNVGGLPQRRSTLSWSSRCECSSRTRWRVGEELGLPGEHGLAAPVPGPGPCDQDHW